VPMPDAGAPPPPPTDAGSSGTAGSGATGRGGSSGTAGATGAGGAGTGGAGGAGGAPHIGGVTTCNCDAAEGPGTAGIALVLASLLWVARRRRAATVRSSRS
jgi:uncharacterized protein (TIGR03382 family)